LTLQEEAGNQAVQGLIRKTDSEADRGINGAVRSPGSPLDAQTRSFFEPRFGRDLSNVRIHADAAAGESAQSIQARAYALGNHVVFGPGHYDPDSNAGRSLLAHELSHTIQQGGTQVTGINPGQVLARSSDAQEAEARFASTSVLSGTIPHLTTGAAPAIACEAGHAPGGLHDDDQLGDAIRAFNEHNSSLGADVLGKLRSGILKATGATKSFEVGYDFFDFYSSWNNSVRQMTADEEKKARAVDRLAVTDTTLGFTATTLRSDVLGFDSLRLGNLLLHEFTHAFHFSGWADTMAYQEGQSYGTEYFYAKGGGDTDRVNKIKSIMTDDQKTSAVCGGQVTQCRDDFRIVYGLLTGLAEIVNTGSSSRLPFSELNSTTAQKVEVDVMRTYQNPGAEVEKYKNHVKEHLSSFPDPLGI
jgi:hypothetical protein